MTDASPRSSRRIGGYGFRRPVDRSASTENPVRRQVLFPAQAVPPQRRGRPPRWGETQSPQRCARVAGFFQSWCIIDEKTIGRVGASPGAENTCGARRRIAAAPPRAASKLWKQLESMGAVSR